MAFTELPDVIKVGLDFLNERGLVPKRVAKELAGAPSLFAVLTYLRRFVWRLARKLRATEMSAFSINWENWDRAASFRMTDPCDILFNAQRDAITPEMWLSCLWHEVKRALAPHAMRERIIWVFELGDRELEDGPWAGNDYWYEGVPDAVEDDFLHPIYYTLDTGYRTVIIHGDAPEEIDGCKRIRVYPSDGATPCPDYDYGPVPTTAPPCLLCEAEATFDHEQIYIGEGYAAAVYLCPKGSRD